MDIAGGDQERLHTSQIHLSRVEIAQYIDRSSDLTEGCCRQQPMGHQLEFPGGTRNRTLINFANHGVSLTRCVVLAVAAKLPTNWGRCTPDHPCPAFDCAA